MHASMPGNEILPLFLDAQQVFLTLFSPWRNGHLFLTHLFDWSTSEQVQRLTGFAVEKRFCGAWMHRREQRRKSLIRELRVRTCAGLEASDCAGLEQALTAELAPEVRAAGCGESRVREGRTYSDHP